MPGIALIGDWVKLKAWLKKLELDSNDKKTLNRRIAVYLREASVDRFDTQTSPDGEAWKPLSPVTIELRRKKDSNDEMNILVNNSDLKNSITFKALVSGAVVGTIQKYAAVQQLGGKAGRNRKVEIPARPYLGVSNDDSKEIMTILEEFMEERLL